MTNPQLGMYGAFERGMNANKTKLMLNRETLRTLSSQHLHAVAGGRTSIFSNLTLCCGPPPPNTTDAICDSRDPRICMLTMIEEDCIKR